MENTLWDLLDEAIRLELKVSELYLCFHHSLPLDAAFWWQLAIEEKNHAALLRNGKEHFLANDLFPLELLAVSLESLQNAFKEIEALIRAHEANPFSREAALQNAIHLEETAGELHFELAMESENQDPAIALFKRLNREDKHHGQRLRAYLQKVTGTGQVQ